MLQGARKLAMSADLWRRNTGEGEDREERTPRRLFADDAGVLWTAELRRPRLPAMPGHPTSPLILFWSDSRACLATVRSTVPLSDLSEEDLRRHLQACLSG